MNLFCLISPLLAFLALHSNNVVCTNPQPPSGDASTVNAPQTTPASADMTTPHSSTQYLASSEHSKPSDETSGDTHEAETEIDASSGAQGATPRLAGGDGTPFAVSFGAGGGTGGGGTTTGGDEIGSGGTPGCGTGTGCRKDNEEKDEKGETDGGGCEGENSSNCCSWSSIKSWVCCGCKSHKNADDAQGDDKDLKKLEDELFDSELAQKRAQEKLQEAEEGLKKAQVKNKNEKKAKKKLEEAKQKVDEKGKKVEEARRKLIEAKQEAKKRAEEAAKSSADGTSPERTATYTGESVGESGGIMITKSAINAEETHNEESNDEHKKETEKKGE